MKNLCKLLAGLFLLASMSACGEAASSCTPGSITYSNDKDAFPSASAQAALNLEAAQVEIGNQTIEVDRVITGPLCNEHLQGVVYVSCELVLKEWIDQPDFLDGCVFTVEPGTVIYVAAHNNSAYYKGCAACHASEAP